MSEQEARNSVQGGAPGPAQAHSAARNGDAPAPPKGKSRRFASDSAPAVRGYPESVTRLIDELARLPGIGRRSAERLAFHILKSPSDSALGLSRAISDVKEKVRHCRVCYNLADASTQDSSLCAICAAASGPNPSRDASTVMVVEQPKDLIALEQTGMYKGVYHVLMGRISPLEGVGAGDLTIADLLARVDDPSRNSGEIPVREVVLALNPTLEGDGTALYLQEELARHGGGAGVSITRLARGLPTGSQLEYANKAVLADAIEGRRSVSRGS